MFKDYGFCYKRNINLSVANKIIDQKKKKNKRKEEILKSHQSTTFAWL